ncbi:hypothetical protein ACFX1Q_035274 [Malus domestica]
MFLCPSVVFRFVVVPAEPTLSPFHNRASTGRLAECSVSASVSEPSIQSEISISHRSLALDVLSAEAPLEDIPFAVGESTSDVIHEDNPTAPSSGSTIR